VAGHGLLNFDVSLLVIERIAMIDGVAECFHDVVQWVLLLILDGVSLEQRSTVGLVFDGVCFSLLVFLVVSILLFLRVVFMVSGSIVNISGSRFVCSVDRLR
jgi:hypothetical protein